MSDQQQNKGNVEQFGYKQELKRALSLRDVVLYGVLFMVIIAPQSIFGEIQVASGGMTPLVYIVGFVAISFTALSYMRMSNKFPIAGSVYAYVQRGINPPCGLYRRMADSAGLPVRAIPALHYGCQLGRGADSKQSVVAMDSGIRYL